MLLTVNWVVYTEKCNWFTWRIGHRITGAAKKGDMETGISFETKDNWFLMRDVVRDCLELIYKAELYVKVSAESCPFP